VVVAGERLRRGERIRTRREFREVSRRGRRAASPSFVVLVSGRECGGGPRLGLTVSRKVGNAVERNRIKRRVREWFRRAKPCAGSAVDVVVIARREALALEQDELGRVLDDLVARSVGAER
jgi:ribonuclease P protein component